MSRNGVSYEDVALAADQLQRNRQNITIGGVRRILGRGSASTISRHLTRWRASNQMAITQPQPGMESEQAPATRPEPKAAPAGDGRNGTLSLRKPPVSDHDMVAFFRLFLDQLPDYPILMTDADGRVMRCNAGVAQRLGYRRSDLVGQSIESVFPRDERTRESGTQTLEQAAAVGHIRHLQRCLRRDGARLWADVSIRPLRNAEGEASAFVYLVHEISPSPVQPPKPNDPLTGLANRSDFLRQIHTLLAHAQRGGYRAALIVIDLEHFKRINDEVGRTSGDRLLQEVATRLQSRIRLTDVAGRLGSDEFAVLQTHIRHPDAAGVLTAKLLDALKTPFFVDDRTVVLNASGGIALYPEDGESDTTLLSGARAALTEAKHDPEHQLRYHNERMQRGYARRRRLEAHLTRLFEDDALALHYQPQVDLRTGRVVGLEALLRWDQWQENGISVADLVDTAERTGRSGDLDRWVLNAACAQSRAWQASGLDPVPVSVNLSVTPDAVERLEASVSAALREHDLDPSLLSLEIRGIGGGADAVLSERLSGLRERGVRVTVEDYSPTELDLSRLAPDSVDVLKVDAGLLADPESDPGTAAAVHAIVSLCHALGIRVVAERIETADQLAFFRDQRCEAGQGYLLGRPMPEAAVADLLRQPQSLLPAVGH